MILFIVTQINVFFSLKNKYIPSLSKHLKRIKKTKIIFYQKSLISKNYILLIERNEKYFQKLKKIIKKHWKSINHT